MIIQVIIEWRALTVAVLDVVYDAWKKKYEVSAQEFPLVKVCTMNFSVTDRPNRTSHSYWKLGLGKRVV